MMKDMSMHITDIIQNSIKAGASRIDTVVAEDEENDIFSFSVRDNGCGIPPEILKTIRDPFTTSRTTRKVGLGIPMLEQTCVQCGGYLDIESETGKGTSITAVMKYGNIDRPPLGNIAGTLLALIAAAPEELKTFDLYYSHTRNGKTFIMDTAEIKSALDGVPITEPPILLWISKFIQEGLEEIGLCC